MWNQVASVRRALMPRVNRCCQTCPITNRQQKTISKWPGANDLKTSQKWHLFPITLSLNLFFHHIQRTFKANPTVRIEVKPSRRGWTRSGEVSTLSPLTKRSPSPGRHPALNRWSAWRNAGVERLRLTARRVAHYAERLSYWRPPLALNII